MTEKIIILDAGSQVTQLIGRRLRELNVFCEIYPYNKMPEIDPSVKGVIISGSPCSVRDANAPQIDIDSIIGKLPLLGICYGARQGGIPPTEWSAAAWKARSQGSTDAQC